MQNNKLSEVKGKELVAAGHQFAKAMSMDTPLIEIAKMIAELASRLDCVLVRGDELQKQLTQRDAQIAALTAENVVLRKAHPQPFGPIMMQALDAYEKDREHESETGMLNAFFILRDSINIETPATTTAANALRAEGAEALREHPAIKLCSLTHVCDEVAQQLREGKA